MIRHFCLSGGADFAILTLSYPYNFTEFLRKLWQDWKGGRRHLDEKREDLGPLLVEQFRQQMNNLSAAIQLLTPVVREKAGPQYDPYLAILHQSLYRLIRMVGNLEYLELPEGELPLREGTLDLAGLCRELGEQVSSIKPWLFDCWLAKIGEEALAPPAVAYLMPSAFMRSRICCARASDAG